MTQTLTEKLNELREGLVYEHKVSSANTVYDAIQAVYDRDREFALNVTLSREVDRLTQLHRETTVARDTLIAEVAAARKAHDTLPGATYWAGLAVVYQTERDEIAIKCDALTMERDTDRALFNMAEVELNAARAERTQAGEDYRVVLNAALKERDAAIKERDEIHLRAASALAEMDMARKEKPGATDWPRARIVPEDKLAPPSPLNLVERVLRLEREVLFVRPRPAPGRWPPRR